MGTIDMSRPFTEPPRVDTIQLLSIAHDQGVDSRGGSFLDTAADVRSADRNIHRLNERLSFFGLRLARTLPK
jgi:hypothetical protein